ncbi:MAG: hypothetical protein V4635_09720 [Bacteroidota bacterium]
MKSLLKFILATFLLLGCGHSFCQLSIDLGTGVSNTPPHSLLPINSAVNPYNSVDDTWTYGFIQATPNLLLDPNMAQPTSFFPVGIGNGIQDMTDPCGQFQPSSSPHDPSGGARWISPYLNPNGEHAYNAVFGYYFYKMTFNTSFCSLNLQECNAPVQSFKAATFKFDYIGYDDTFHYLWVNGQLISPFPYGSSWGIGSVTNVEVSIPPSYINSGQNVIMIMIGNNACGPGNPYNTKSYTGLEINGELQLDYWTLTDKDGNEKSEFCIGEDILIEGGNINTNNYTLELFDVGGNTPLSSIQNLRESANLINLTNLFQNSTSPFVFQPNHPYTVKITATTPCGQVKFEKDFKYVCCDKSLDASFNLTTSNGNTLLGNSGKGTHLWNVYKSPNVNTGPYSAVGTFNSSNFSMPLTPGYQFCYYVTHQLTNVCGSSCQGQSICNLACEDGECILDKPKNLNQNQSGLLTWDAVPGASVNYIIEINVNDPSCPCYHGGSGGSSISAPQIIHVDNNSYQLSPADFSGLNDGIPFCYSWRVYAICKDGSRSIGSAPKCSN